MVTLREVLSLLDPSDDSAWTADGQPRVELVAALLGSDTTRAAITAAAPDFSRLSPVLPPEPADAGGGAGIDEDADVGEQVLVVLKPATPEDHAAAAAVAAAASTLAALPAEDAAARLAEIQAQRHAAEAEVAAAEAKANELRDAERAAETELPAEDQRRADLKAHLDALQAQLKHSADAAQIDRAMGQNRGYGRQRPRYPRHGW